ncbi:MAG TPA: TonB-dependent receptor plug domain-containing protein, partial [Planctomycetota bacterium]|nr:TonB-dependent receptor plug domain-containing protein [Planctomycetota bacterium]
MNLLLALFLSLQDPTSPPAPRPEPAPPQAEKKAPPKEDEKEVVIIGQRRESNILDVPSGVTVVTGDDIRNSGATNIVEVVQKQAGFFASGTNKGAYDQIVDIRGYNNGGGNGQRVLVLVDGRRTNTVSGNSTDWASIPIENISRIEIVRGPAAAMYGDGALAGVVNIITKRG